MSLNNKNDFFLLEQIVRKNFASRYKDSILGILWSVVRPLLDTIILTIVFSTIFTGTIENYPVYLLAGRCIFTFFVGSVNAAMNSIRGNINILQKTAAPKHIFVIGSIISEFFNFIISFVLLIGVMIVTNAPFYFSVMPLTILPVVSLIIMVIGLGFIVSILCVYYTDIQHLWSVLSMALMYMCALFYPMDIIPEPYHHYLLLNPVYWIIEQFRFFMAYGVIPKTVCILNSFLFSTIILVIGIIIFKKYEKSVTIKF